MKKNRNNCLTKPMYGGSVCLSDGQDCHFAVRFGFSFRCTHPDKASFYGHINGEYTLDELRKLSRKLRVERRSQFVDALDEFGRNFLQVRKSGSDSGPEDV
jgi:hypothetical protein